MDVRAENRGRQHQKMRFPAATVVGKLFDPWASGQKIRNVRGKSGPKNICLCRFSSLKQVCQFWKCFTDFVVFPSVGPFSKGAEKMVYGYT